MRLEEGGEGTRHIRPAVTGPAGCKHPSQIHRHLVPEQRQGTAETDPGVRILLRQLGKGCLQGIRQHHGLLLLYAEAVITGKIYLFIKVDIIPAFAIRTRSKTGGQHTPHRGGRVLLYRTNPRKSLPGIHHEEG